MIKVQARDDGSAEILIYEPIGQDFFGSGLTARRFIADLERLGDVKDILVRINSPGGEVFDGIAIYNALKNHPAQVHVQVDGLAASIASVIAMAGDLITMGDGAMFMIHNPFTIAIGDADDMRQTADRLDKVTESLMDAYEARTGIERDELKAMLDAETWFTAAEAIEQGFADERTKEAEPDENAQASHRDAFKQFAADFRAKSVNVSPLRIAAMVRQSASADASTVEATMPAPAPASVPNTDIENAKTEAAQAALKVEAARRKAIRDSFGRFSDEHRALLDECLEDLNCSAEAASKKLLTKLGEGAEPMRPAHVVPAADARDKFRDGAAKAILARAGIAKDEGGNEFRGMSLIALASHSLGLAGVSTRGLTAREVASKIFATHTSSDFPALLANTAGKALLRGYDAFPRTWQQWCAVRPVSDFKQVTNLQMGTFSSLLTIPEGGEYKGGTIGEDSSTNQARTKGRKIAFTRQMLINDDLGAFVGFAQKMGTAAARTVNADAYSVINTNAALGDSIALFHASHSNLASSGAVISASTVSAGKAAMRKQKDSDDNEYLNIMPKFLLVPVALEDDAKEFITSTTKIGGSNANSAVPNVHRNSLEVVSDPTLDATSTTAWYMVADPAIVELVQAVFLDGQQTPFIDEEVNFQTDALEMKVRLDYGFAAVDFRAGYKNAGA